MTTPNDDGYYVTEGPGFTAYSKLGPVGITRESDAAEWTCSRCHQEVWSGLHSDEKFYCEPCWEIVSAS